jgi:hypothetical protein
MATMARVVSAKAVTCLFVALLALSSGGCIPLIMAANARSKEQQAQADQDNTLTCWQDYRDQVEALPDIAVRGMRAQQRREECHDQYTDEPEMCSDTDHQVEQLERQYTRVKSDSREARKTCERMDLQTQRSTAAAQNAREAAIDAANRMAANRTVYCTSNRIGNTVNTWCN